jgi:glutamate-1-semialdehyde 2,1-aminomutase
MLDAGHPMDGRSAAARTVAAVHAAYAEWAPHSRSWFERASRSLVGGVSGTVRHFAPHPLYFAGGQGATTTDVDGHEYVDCFLCGASLLLGHRRPEIVEALDARRTMGSLVLNPMLATEVAEQLQRMVPAAQRVRLVNSGTEAVMSALRFARAFTGRPLIVKFAGTYHGQADEVLIGVGERARRLGGGIPESSVAATVVLGLWDLDALRVVLDEGQVAAVLLDPSMHHGGLFVGTAGHYQAIADLAHQHGALVVFDEVISGFRIAAGGAQDWFGIVPDLAVYAKAFAAGEKLGAVVGRADVMQVADPSMPREGPFAFQSGTGNDATGGQVAALTAMRIYERLGADGAYDSIGRRARRLAAGLCEAFTSRGLPCQSTQLGPIVRLFLTEHPLDQARAASIDRTAIDLFHLAMLLEGVLTLPGSNDFFLSFAHDDDHIDWIVDAAARTLDRFDFAPLVGA